MMKFGSEQGCAEGTGRQMAPRKSRIRGKMAAFSTDSPKLNGFRDGLTGRQNRQGVRLPAVAASRVAGHVTATTDSVNHCFQRIHRLLDRSAEQERSGPLGPGRRRDGPEAGMRSQHGGRTRSPSSGRVLAPVATRARSKLTFVTVSAAAVLPASRQRLRSRLGGNGEDRGASSGPRLTSGQNSANFVRVLRQDQTGISRMDKMERTAAAIRKGAAEGEDDHEA